MKLLTPKTYGACDPFNMFDGIEYINNANDIRDGCLILWGGEDIGTSIYDQKPNRFCHQYKASERDKREMEYIAKAIYYDMPIIGICRGAQLLCAVAGGKLAQHIEGHGRSHLVTLHDEEDTVIMCNSSHHQMMLPPTGAVVLASSEATHGVGENNEAVVHKRVNEVVYFPALRALGIQPHPEWDNCPQDFIDYCKRKIQEYLL